MYVKFDKVVCVCVCVFVYVCVAEIVGFVLSESLGSRRAGDAWMECWARGHSSRKFAIPPCLLVALYLCKFASSSRHMRTQACKTRRQSSRRCLKISSPCARTHTEYMCTAGHTFATIAPRFRTTWLALWSLNNGPEPDVNPVACCQSSML